jgi:glycine oxidase
VKSSTDVLIVGAEAIGCSIAYFLRKQGVEVIVVEKGEIGDQASSAAAGLLAPIRLLSEQDSFKALQLADLTRFSSFVEEFEQTGTLRLLPSEKIIPARAWAEVWRDAGYHIEVLPPDELYQREPLLSAGSYSTVSIADQAQVVPVQLVEAYAQVLAAPSPWQGCAV